MTGFDRIKGPWRQAVDRHAQVMSERQVLQDALDDALGRPRSIRAAQPRRWLGLTAFEWNLLRVVVLWSGSMLAIGFAIGHAL